MKKKILFTILVMMLFINPVFADSYTSSYCNGLKSTLRIVGEIVNVVKIVVPIIVIGFASYDLFKIVVSGKDDGFSKAFKSIITRVIIGVLVFFIPSILDFGFSLVDGWSNYELGYDECVTCVLNVKECR